MAHIPEFVPLYAPITKRSEDRISAVLKLVYEKMNPVPEILTETRKRQPPTNRTLDNEERLIIYACLCARRWNVDNAFKMMRSMHQHRTKYNLDHRNYFPSPIAIRGFDEMDLMRRLGCTGQQCDEDVKTVVGLLEPLVKISFHYWDKRGIPVAYCAMGKIDIRTLTRNKSRIIPDGEDLVDYLARFASYVIETGWRICRYQDMHLADHPDPSLRVEAKHRNFVTVVVDMKGMSFGSHIHMPALSIARAIINVIDANYADVFHRALVINCTPLVLLGWSIVRLFFRESLRAKITFVSVADTPVALDRVIGLDCVPAFFGGRCKCTGGCMPSYLLSTRDSTQLTIKASKEISQHTTTNGSSSKDIKSTTSLDESLHGSKPYLREMHARPVNAHA